MRFSRSIAVDLNVKLPLFELHCLNDAKVDSEGIGQFLKQQRSLSKIVTFVPVIRQPLETYGSIIAC